MQSILVDEIMDNLKIFNVYLVLLFRKSWTELDGKMVCLKKMRHLGCFYFWDNTRLSFVNVSILYLIF